MTPIIKTIEAILPLVPPLIEKIIIPNKIGIITSGSGSAYQDILNVLSRRNPNIDVLLKSVKVQGNGSAEEIVDAIEIFNNYDDVDLLVIARGGGSIEDL